MSERGSFVTEYIYCSKCFEIMLKALCWDGVTQVAEFPIIAGKISSSYSGGELHQMQCVADDVGALLCHDVRVGVLCDSGDIEVMEMRAAGGRGEKEIAPPDQGRSATAHDAGYHARVAAVRNDPEIAELRRLFAGLD